MKILVTGAQGFVGKNLVCALKNIQYALDRTHPEVKVDEVMEFDLDTSEARLDAYLAECDFIFHLAGVNRPKDAAEFMHANADFTRLLTEKLKEKQNLCPILLASSMQATLIGRYDSDYGRSKLQAENTLFAYAKETGATVYVYRFPNLFGKWCRPNYNSVIATFCHNRARDLDITIHDASATLELFYIDDLIAEMLRALVGDVKRCKYEGLTPVLAEDGAFCKVAPTHSVTLGEVAALLERFRAQPHSLLMPEMEDGSFEKKLYSTYLSYLPEDKISFPLEMKEDARGSFTELLRTKSFGQVSVNVSRPGVTKGQHWHHSKWEQFIVVSGRALIQMRKIGTDEVLEFEVSGKRIEAVQMLPGYTHNIINLSDTEDLVTVMFANEIFDPAHPDTYYEEV